MDGCRFSANLRQFSTGSWLPDVNILLKVQAKMVFFPILSYWLKIYSLLVI